MVSTFCIAHRKGPVAIWIWMPCYPSKWYDWESGMLSHKFWRWCLVDVGYCRRWWSPIGNSFICCKANSYTYYKQTAHLIWTQYEQFVPLTRIKQHHILRTNSSICCKANSATCYKKLHLLQTNSYALHTNSSTCYGWGQYSGNSDKYSYRMCQCFAISVHSRWLLFN